MIRYLVAGALALFVAAPASAQGCNYPPNNQVAKSTDKAALDRGVACLKAQIKQRDDTVLGLTAANKIDAQQLEARRARLVALATKPADPPAPPKPPVTPPAPPKPSAPVKPTVGDAVEPPLGKPVVKAEPAVASNFTVADFLVPSWGTGDIPPSGKPDVVGAFRFICYPGQISRDDAIVFPGQPGKSHLHQWFGNTAANAYSTYASLRATGDSTCNNKLNRSAYWMPAMLNGRGGVVRPDYVSIYYKRRPASDPQCLVLGPGGCVDLPRGLRFVFGYDMVTDTQPTGAAYFNCDGPGAVPGHYKLIAEAARVCPKGARLGAVINAPSCWNGKELDSPDHRSHVAYTFYNNQGQEVCPVTHPYSIPHFTMGAWYAVSDVTLDGAKDATGWTLASDDMTAMGHGTLPGGTTFHADWFGAWDDDVMALWTSGCINLLLNCSGGDLGTGKQIRQVWPERWSHPSPLVPIPAAGVTIPAV